MNAYHILKTDKIREKRTKQYQETLSRSNSQTLRKASSLDFINLGGQQFHVL